ncbi:urinary bladder development [Pristimantis euphronides]
MTIALTNTYYTTNGRSTAPYVADTFDNPDCTGNPNSADVSKYVYHVGSNENCLSTTFCNGPLANNTVYRFMYVFYDSSKAMVFRSDWSAPITTKHGKEATSIDTWPGRRSGGMIVLTSILSVLIFLVLASLVATGITSLMSPTKELEPTRHESRSTHVPQKAEGDSSLGGPERYAANPQP